ncbi:hypothetical protein ALI22I_04530 [Saccharothrix sp. ALI-22-I]|uniref:nucleotide disphospho-sugar-binding domain-containing protein n=1 Tax=Saccharothrix sp. ALI-22-I TaxID=1933778 RepID=UPI00097C0760|nr:nucleotide disphospho-sugar-binding domain-containing protein [Saccharothrix sp. ALI-22-I]ONI92327.1 hypothetical protein ALI22I_04530 [Saccharothrix sp. ALI-22-I]
MRVLFTSLPANSHFYNLVPLAWALRVAGHDVRVAVRPDAADMVTNAGLTAVPVGEPVDVVAAAATSGYSPHGRKIPADGLPGMELFDQVGSGDYFEGKGKHLLHIDDRLLEDLVWFGTQWRPDLVIWDAAAYSGPVVAHILGVPHVRVLFAMDLVGWHRSRLSKDRADGLRDVLAGSLGRFGVGFAEEVAVGQATIEQIPSWMRLPVELEYIPVRFVPYNGPAVIPRWLDEPPAKPRICVSLGLTRRSIAAGAGSLEEFIDSERKAVKILLRGAAGLDVEVIATLTADEAREIGPLPGNVRIHDYVPLHELLRTCSAIIHHGGTTTQETAAINGVPQLILPGLYWDEPRRAELLAARGAGLVLDRERLTEAHVGDQLARLLTEPSFAANAATIRQEAQAAPSPHDIVPRLEALVAEHEKNTERPVLAADKERDFSAP